MELTISPKGNAHWVDFDAVPLSQDAIETRCTEAFIQQALAEVNDVGDAKVAAVTLHTAGTYEIFPPEYEMPGLPMPVVNFPDMPAFCEVIIHLRETPNHVSHVTVCVPLAWNERFLGTFGGGNRVTIWHALPDFIRNVSAITALRNGFATARTDGAIRDKRWASWGLKPGTSEVDWELTENWAHRSTHAMTVLGKAVTQAIHGRGPLFSYGAGASGGGRQAVVEAQRYPNDYDGIWSGDPAINWTKLNLASVWPALLMKEYGVALPSEKLRAFREAAIAACDGVGDGLRDGIIGVFDPCDYDAHALIGQSTDAGVITAIDAEVMNKIWEGPRASDGRFLWYGMRRGTESWADNYMGTGVAMTQSTDRGRQPVPFPIGEDYMRAWLIRDPEWKWEDINLAEYERMFEAVSGDLAHMEANDPDLSGFRDAGGKLILTHAGNDQLISVDSSIDYYRSVLDVMRGEGATKKFFRLFVGEGDGHCLCNNPGAGILPADAMAALMRWVEEGVAPDEILATEIDLASGERLASRPTYAYPMVPHYRGDGDPKNAASFRPVHFSERQQSA